MEAPSASSHPTVIPRQHHFHRGGQRSPAGTGATGEPKASKKKKKATVSIGTQPRFRFGQTRRAAHAQGCRPKPSRRPGHPSPFRATYHRCLAAEQPTRPEKGGLTVNLATWKKKMKRRSWLWPAPLTPSLSLSSRRSRTGPPNEQPSWATPGSKCQFGPRRRGKNEVLKSGCVVERLNIE